MPSINYRLRSASDKNVSIYIHLSMGRGRVFETPTGFYINPKDWKIITGKYGFPKNSNLIEIKTLKSDLNNLRSQIYAKINVAESNGTLIDTNWLKEQIDVIFNRTVKDEIKNESLSVFIQEIIDNSDSKIIQGGRIGLSKSRVKGYITFKGVIERFQFEMKSKITFRDIDVSFEEKFKNWLLKSNGYSINYAGKNIDNLKAVCREAQRIGLDVNPHALRLITFSENKENRNILTLSFNELEKIECTELIDNHLLNARKWLLLGCEIGQRGGDLLSIEGSNFRKNNHFEFIDVKQQKTGKIVTIPVTERIRKIISGGLPYKISIQKFNTYLKEICEISKIDKPFKGKLFDPEKGFKVDGVFQKHSFVTSHVCRRSFATNYYKKVPTPILMTITGHSKESMFLDYIGAAEDKDTNAKLMLEYVNNIEKSRTKQKSKEKIDLKSNLKII